MSTAVVTKDTKTEAAPAAAPAQPLPPSLPSASASASAPYVPASALFDLSFRPTFELIEASTLGGSSSTARIKVRIRTENYDPLHKWMPFIDWGMPSLPFPPPRVLISSCARRRLVRRVHSSVGHIQCRCIAQKRCDQHSQTKGIHANRSTPSTLCRLCRSSHLI
jgi:hypothetical protein